MYRVRKDQVHQRPCKDCAIIRKPVVVIHIRLIIQPGHDSLILPARRVYGIDKDVANRIRIYEVAPEAMRNLRAVDTATDILKKAVASMYFLRPLHCP